MQSRGAEELAWRSRAVCCRRLGCGESAGDPSLCRPSLPATQALPERSHSGPHSRVSRHSCSARAGAKTTNDRRDRQVLEVSRPDPPPCAALGVAPGGGGYRGVPPPSPAGPRPAAPPEPGVTRAWWDRAASADVAGQRRGRRGPGRGRPVLVARPRPPGRHRAPTAPRCRGLEVPPPRPHLGVLLGRREVPARPRGWLLLEPDFPNRPAQRRGRTRTR